MRPHQLHSSNGSSIMLETQSLLPLLFHVQVGNTPLIIASAYVEVVKELLSSGAALDIQNKVQ